jgi:hypothetical protein
MTGNRFATIEEAIICAKGSGAKAFVPGCPTPSYPHGYLIAIREMKNEAPENALIARRPTESGWFEVGAWGPTLVSPWQAVLHYEARLIEVCPECGLANVIVPFGPDAPKIMHLFTCEHLSDFDLLPCRGKHPTSVIGDGTCGYCRPLYEQRYPQGWQSYPGDVCPHGTYVGGCGVDHLCPACEAGEPAGKTDPTWPKCWLCEQKPGVYDSGLCNRCYDWVDDSNIADLDEAAIKAQYKATHEHTPTAEEALHVAGECRADCPLCRKAEKEAEDSHA